MSRLFFVGGPLAGEYRELPSAPHVFHLEVYSRLMSPPEGAPNSPLVEGGARVVYQHVLELAGDDEPIHIYVPENRGDYATDFEVLLHRLIQGYYRPKPLVPAP